MRFNDTQPVDMGKKVKAALFWTNLVRLVVYWAVFYVAMIPFFEFTWKTLSASFVLAFFAGLINHLRFEMMQAKAMGGMNDMLGSIPPMTDKDIQELSGLFKRFG